MTFSSTSPVRFSVTPHYVEPSIEIFLNQVNSVLTDELPEETLLAISKEKFKQIIEQDDRLLMLVFAIDMIKPELFKKIWDSHLNHITFEEWCAPMKSKNLRGAPLLVCLPTAINHFPLIWNKFRSQWTAEIMWRAAPWGEAARLSFAILFLAINGKHKDQAVVREVWQIAKQDLDLQNLLYIQDNGRSHTLASMTEEISQIADIFDEVWQRFGSQLDEKMVTSGQPSLFTAFTNIADSHPKYFLEVWKKVPAHHYNHKSISFIINKHPNLVPALVRRLDEASINLPFECVTLDLLLTKDSPHCVLWDHLTRVNTDYIKAVYNKFHTLLERATTTYAFLLVRIGEHDRVQQIAAQELFIFSDKDHAAFKLYSPNSLRPILDAQLDLSKVLHSLQVKDNLTVEDIAKLTSQAEVAQSGGYLNAFYDIANLLETKLGLIEEVLDLYALVPPTSRHYSAVVAKLQISYYALTTTRPRSDSKKLLKKSVKFALQLRPITTRDMAIQEIASSYLGTNSAQGGIVRTLVPNHLLGLISPTTGPSWIFTVFDDIRDELTLQEKRRTLLNKRDQAL